MNCEILTSISGIDSQLWDQMVGGDNTPFMRYAFLHALEKQGCAAAEFGWFPQHQLIRDQNGNLLGAMPMYAKNNSYGEFVFDWAWADAYQRSGLPYYPKLVVAVPYTPVSGPRILVNSTQLQQSNDSTLDITAQLIQAAISHAKAQDFSSLHVLFPEQTLNAQLSTLGLMPRIACQFHWRNREADKYSDFNQFLQQLSSRKRKNILRERKSVQQSPIEIRVLHGDEINDTQWRDFHRHYASTFDRLGGYATLSQAFFQEIGRTMAQQIVLIQAYDGQKAVASAFCMRDENHLYGRHWGCDQEYKNLHFELCYYQGIEYCIEHGLERFEPGAQGEHKLSRGFLPTLTYSSHWIADPEFSPIISDFLQQETRGIQQYKNSLMTHSPYKQVN